jgi:protein CpxP
MKKLLLVALLAIGVSAVSKAQGFQRKSPAEQAADLKTSLSLNDDQVGKITAIYTASAKTSDSIRTAAGDDRQSAFPKMQAVRTAAQTKIKALLTADQAKAFDALPQNQPRQGGPGGGAPRN